MASVLRFFISRWFLSLVGTVLLAGLVWFLGPLLAFLEGFVARLIAVGVMLLLWLGINLLLDLRRRGRERKLEAGVAAGAVDPSQAASAEEAAALSDKLTTAMALLKKARGTRGYLYEQPWYVIIGPPGAGKTTALLNAGLKFPLAAEMGQGAVAGVGGTRLCDWWFTENAVMIDTAGRYTTQDSDATVDRAGWEAFLDLLKRTRTRQPLNGVVVAIALSDIAAASADERLAHARAIRRRVKELETRLAVRMPIYAIFTKSDLIAGFTEFFDDLDRDKRDQVWGATFQQAPAETGTVGQFAAEFKLLVERLEARLYERMQAERSPDRRALIAGFPTQVASLELPLMSFLQEAFGGSRMDPAPMLRGAYMSSGTQEGTPIDRLTGAMSRSFGLDQRRAPSLRPVQGRSYFLGRLLKEVIFGEAMLVSERPGARRRVMLLRAAGFAACLLFTLGAGALLWQARDSGAREIDATAAALSAYEKTAAGLPLNPVADADLPRLVPLLDQARGLPHGVDHVGEGNSGWTSFGLSQDSKLEAAATSVYRHALERALLPRLVWRLEAQMRGNISRPEFLYEATRVYLMLGSGGPMDRGLVHEWMTLDWQAAFPGAAAAPFRDTLVRHLDALLAEPLPPVLLDGELVAQARATFSRVPLAQRVYSRIRPSAAAQRVAPWKPSDALGPAGVRVFLRASGKALSDGIPGFLTVEGFHKVLLPSLGSAAKSVASESWVLGKRAELDPSGPEMRALEHDVIQLYQADYIEAWDAMQTDLDVVPLRSMTQAAQDLYILSSPQSPMRDLLASIARQLTLSVPPPPPTGVAGAVGAAAAAVQGAAASATAAASGADSRLGGLFGGAAAGAPVVVPGSEIDARYKALRDLVGSGAGAPIDQVLKSLNDLQQQLAKMAAAPIGSSTPPPPAGSDPALALRAEAARQPQPLSRWLLAMAGSGTALRSGSAKQQIAAAFNGAGGPASLCTLAIKGRYPFERGSTNDVPLDDFAKLFAPGGLLDGFFNTQLRPYVDMSAKTWKPQPVDGVPAPVSPEDLAQFQRAAVIRDLFFASGGTAPTVRFDITPITLDSAARQVTLDLDGTAVTYAQGPPRSTQITWPGPNRMQNVRLVFDPPPAGGTGVLSASGPWAMFRLFDNGKLQQEGSAERFTLSFQLGERKVVYEIRAGSVLNPLAPGILQDFRCPTVQ
jgi:type VI secretion system protein ImpL